MSDSLFKSINYSANNLWAFIWNRNIILLTHSLYDLVDCRIRVINKLNIIVSQYVSTFNYLFNYLDRTISFRMHQKAFHINLVFLIFFHVIDLNWLSFVFFLRGIVCRLYVKSLPLQAFETYRQRQANAKHKAWEKEYSWRLALNNGIIRPACNLNAISWNAHHERERMLAIIYDVT